MGDDSFLKRRRQKAKAASTLPVGYESSEDIEMYPHLAQMMSVAQVDNEPRKLSSLALFVDQGRLKACLKDPDTAQVGFLTLETLHGALQAIEDALAADTMEWRKDKKARV